MKPDPTYYLSTSRTETHPGGAWRLISGGVPLCADTPDRDRAFYCAVQNKIPCESLAIWDGDAGAWRAVCPRCLDLRPGVPAGVPDAPHPGPFTPELCTGCTEAIHARAIIDLGAAWPFPRVGDARRAGHGTWFRTIQDHADQCLNVLPPRYFSGGFFLGEAADHDDRGVAVHAAFTKIRGRWYVREVARDKIATALDDLRAALGSDGAA